MAIGWLALLKAVPWAEVVRKAPEIAESAKKLWGTVARKSPHQESEVRTVFTSKDQELNWLKDRLDSVETANSELHNQMLTTSELIKALADQNAQLIKSVELNRIRIIRLSIITSVIGVIALYCVATILFKII
ncbi:MAG: hypothetical protein V4575_04345 [Pseudomonadota bacterium]